MTAATALFHDLFYAIGGAIKDSLGLLRPTKNRSYWHGYKFDRAGSHYRTEGLSFEIPQQSIPRSYRSRFYFDIYEKPERELVRKYVPATATILELGACIGVVSCVTNKLLATPTRHVAVEANPELIRTLTKNRERNDCKFIIDNCIVGRGKETTFRIGKLMTANRLGARRGRVVRIPMKTIEQVEQEHGLKFDTLIADIEGAEAQLVEENPDFVSRLKLAILEVHDSILGSQRADHLRDLMRNAGLQLVDEQSLTEVWGRLES